MMICDADFEELFPALFQPEPVRAARPKAQGPSAGCIARWDDDGGRQAASVWGAKLQVLRRANGVSSDRN